ncbi:MAG TPA: hypothetical protein DDZ51_13980 [Planctomycetaceae bacterium]|nr:hypothetical protein [Planctomycetaceae bacterium]
MSSQTVSTASSTKPLPEGWVDHPKIPITRRAVLAGVAIMILGVIGAVASIYARRTQLEKTMAFLGADAILAIQILPSVTLQLEPLGQVDGAQAKTIDLTGTPGLGHLRHALLDERHYDWQSRTDSSVQTLRSPETRFATVTFSDPKDHFAPATLNIELSQGWVSRAGADDRVRLIERAQPAVRHFLTVISNAKQAHYDNRAKEDR